MILTEPTLGSTSGCPPGVRTHRGKRTFPRPSFPPLCEARTHPEHPNRNSSHTAEIPATIWTVRFFFFFFPRHLRRCEFIALCDCVSPSGFLRCFSAGPRRVGGLKAPHKELRPNQGHSDAEGARSRLLIDRPDAVCRLCARLRSDARRNVGFGFRERGRCLGETTSITGGGGGGRSRRRSPRHAADSHRAAANGLSLHTHRSDPSRRGPPRPEPPQRCARSAARRAPLAQRGLRLSHPTSSCVE